VVPEERANSDSHDPPVEITQAQGPPEDDDHGRVGYGAYAKFSPALLGLLIVAVVAYIGWNQRQPDEVLQRPGQMVDQLAPDFGLALLNGEQLSLEDLEGEAVVLNFWGSWCAPCRTEMPELQAMAERLERDGIPATIVGVGIKNDNDDNARDFVDSLGLTYPIGRDTAGESPALGPIEQAYGVTTYPATFFLRPDGTVFAVCFGAVTADEVEEYIDASLA